MKASWTRDGHGIPQIVADDIIGLHWGMGYSHAMDRGGLKARKPPGSGAAS